MPRIKTLLLCTLGLLLIVAAGATLRVEAQTQAPAKKSDVRKVGVWVAPAGGKQMPIWPGVAPDAVAATHSPETVETADTPEAPGGHASEGVFDVSTPTMTVFPPKGRNTGVTIIVYPGGGFMGLAITLEGTEICDWLVAKGVTCVVSKYRVPKGDNYYDETCHCAITPKIEFALEDAQRTIRLVRSQAAALHVDPNKIGVMGFSAGGYLVAQTSNIFAPVYKPVDAIDKVSSRPDFAVALYPGHLCRRGNTFDPSIHVTKRTPPTFLLQAWDDPVDEICNSTMYAQALANAGVPAEVHLFAKGGHAFGLRKKEHPLAMWPSLVEAWMKERGIL